MPKHRAIIAIPSLKALDRRAGHLGRQLAQRLRDAVATGELKPGERLPSTRTLAASLGVARGLVVEAFDQLRAEGYLDARVGAGTRVASTLSHEPLVTAPVSSLRPEPHGTLLTPAAERLAAFARAVASQPQVPFAIAVPAAGIAPDDTWRKLGNRVRASRCAAPAGYADPYGLPALRAAIAEHVRRTRAVRCATANVIITSGTQQGLYMAGRVLLSRADAVWAEDPAYPGLRAVLDDLGVLTHHLPVDEQGLDVARGLALCPTARAAFVTPSHQYPVGMPLSMARRQTLVAWAERQQAWIVEDDYDSELRYAGHPFPAIQGLSPARVIYLGTFSKVLFPALRLGYVIAPSPLVDAFAGARAMLDRHSPPPISTCWRPTCRTVPSRPMSGASAASMPSAGPCCWTRSCRPCRRAGRFSRATRACTSCCGCRRGPTMCRSPLGRRPSAWRCVRSRRCTPNHADVRD